MPHTITAVDDAFDIYLEPGETATFDLPSDAVVPVYCTLHGTAAGAGMAGAIVRHSDTGVAPTAEETATGADIVATDAASGEDGDGSAVLAIVVAGLAFALAVVSLATAHRARRLANTP